MPETRVGFVGIIVEDRAQAPKVNQILSRFASLIRGRMGIPDVSGKVAVIGLVIEGTNDQVGAMTGQIGKLPGVKVKSALSSVRHPTIEGE